jgi:hydrogenase nickel incorporation protein HypB
MDRIAIKTNILKDNQEAAAQNRKIFDEEGFTVINLMSAPGAGKTSLLEATLERLRDEYRVAVIEGDLQTDLDSQRIRALGIPAHQITTGNVCHLDARMIARVLTEFPIAALDLLIIENVGNLICPASYNLGEHLRVVIASTAEGAEKPRKYPVMFHKADAVVLNKTDLAAICGVDITELEANVREVNPHAMVFKASCRTGEGLHEWVSWIRTAMASRVPANNGGISLGQAVLSGQHRA